MLGVLLLCVVSGMALSMPADAQTAPLPPASQIFHLPLPEDDLLLALQTIEGDSQWISAAQKPRDPIQTFASITVFSDNTLIYYDHWESGFEFNIAQPTNLYDAVTNPSGTQIWGDGDPANGHPSGISDDELSAGTIIILDNPVVSSNRTQVNFDGGDKLGATKAISVTRVGWAAGSDTLLAGAIEVYDTAFWGTAYRAPVGVDIPDSVDYQQFEYTGLSIMAGAGGATVQIDVNANGVFDEVVTLAEGEGHLVNGDVHVGARIQADRPVQIDLLTADIQEGYESRFYRLLPLDYWSDSYITPVSTEPSYVAVDGANYTGTATTMWLYNPSSNSIPVQAVTRTGPGGNAVSTTALTVPGGPVGGYLKHVLQSGYATRFVADPNVPFYAVATIDSTGTTLTTPTTAGDNRTWDWGFSPLPDDSLTSQVLTGLGLGRDPSSAVNPGENGNPIWVTAVGNGDTPVTVYVDYDADPDTGPLLDPHSNRYDIAYSLRELDQLRVYNPSGDQTGMLLYVLDEDVNLTAAWGQDPEAASPGAPGLDMGTAVPPLPLFVAAKRSLLLHDYDQDGYPSPNDKLEYSIFIDNTGRLPVSNLSVNDVLPDTVVYLADTTRFIDEFGVTNVLPDRVSPPAPSVFPLGESGIVFTNRSLPVPSTWQLTYHVHIKAFTNLPPGALDIKNTASVGAVHITTSNAVVTPIYGRIGDRVWWDQDGDGLQSPGEPGLNGVQVHLTHTNGVSVLNSGGIPISAVSAADTFGNPGFYQLTGVPAGNYDVHFTPPPGFVFTSKDADGQGLAGPLNSTANTPSGQTDPITLAAGEPIQTIDAGFVEASTIEGRAWLDVNGDGLQQPGEPSLNGVVVRLLDQTGQPIIGLLGTPITAITQDNGLGNPGHYAFDQLYYGHYLVEFELPADHVFTVVDADGAGPAGPENSDAHPVTGQTALITVAPGSSVSAIDAGALTSDLAIQKEVDKPAAATGDTMTFTVTVSNAGPTANTGITISDHLPDGLSYSDHTSSQGLYDAATGLWTVGGLTAGGEATLHIEATIAAGTIGQVLTNTVHLLSSDIPDAGPGNNVAETTVSIASLGITKTSDADGSVEPGGLLTYTIIVTNAGTSAQTGVQVVDSLPSGTTYVADSATISIHPPPGSPELPVNLRVQYENDGTSASLQEIRPRFRIFNDDTNTVALTDITLRYWFTSEPTGDDIFVVDWAQVGTATVTGTFDLADSERYLEVGFEGNAFVPPWLGGNGNVNELPAGAETGGMHLRVRDSAWGYYDQSNDFSWDPAQTTYADYDRVTLYYQGQRVWGYEPADFTSMVYNTSSTFIVTDDVTEISIEAWGAGGGGGKANTGGNDAGGGGGGGGYARGTLAVTPGSTHTVTVGIGGGPAASGGDSWFNATDTVFAEGGGGGGNGSSVGGGGSALGNEAAFTGGNGGAGRTTGAPGGRRGGGGGGSAFATANGQAGETGGNNSGGSGGAGSGSGGDGTQVNDNGQLGWVPGGGGGGGGNNAVGGAGANGQVIVTYKKPVTFSAFAGTTNPPPVLASGWTLAPGSVMTVTFTVQIDDPLMEMAIQNTATVTSDGQTIPVSATVVDPYIHADLAVTKSANTAVLNEGESIVFSVGVTNLSDSVTTTGITVTDLLPAGFSFDSAAANPGTYDALSGLWSVGSLAPGASGTLTVEASAATGSGGVQWTNMARIAASDQADLYPANNVAAATVLVRGADLALRKVADQTAAMAGLPVTYTITVTNTGPAATTGIVVSESLPALLGYVGHSTDQGSYNTTAGTWTIGALMPHEAAHLTLTAMVAEGTGGAVLTNTSAIVHSDATDPNTSNDQASAVVEVSGLRMVKISDADGALLPGDTVGYTIIVSNVGASVQSGIEITDVIPPGSTYVPGSAWMKGPQVTADTVRDDFSAQSYANNEGSIDWQGPWDETDPYGSAGPIGNYVGITSDGRLFFHWAWVDAESIQRQADLSLYYQAGLTVDWEMVGLSVGKTFSILIAPNATAPFVELAQLSGSQSGSSSFDISAYLSETTTIRFENRSVNWGSGDFAYLDQVQIAASRSIVTNAPADAPPILATDQVLQPAEALTITFDVTIDQPSTLTQVVNTVSAVSDQQVEPVISRVADPVLFTDLGLHKSVDSAVALSGDEVEFTVTVTNLGPATATGIVVEDLLPAGLSYVTHIAAQGTYGPGSGVWQVGTLDVHASHALQIVAQIDAGTEGVSITNRAAITTLDQSDPRRDNHADTAIVDVLPSNLALALTKSVSPSGSVPAGATLTYTMEVHNPGAIAHTGLQMTDELPTGVAYVPDSALLYPGAMPVGPPPALAANLTLPADATVWITFDVTVDQPATVTQVVNTATVSSDQFPLISDTVITPIDDQMEVDLVLTKTVDDGVPMVDEPFVFSIRIVNNGPAPVTAIQVQDVLDSALTLLSATASTGTYNAASGAWLLATLPEAAEATLALTVSAPAGMAGQTITNVAQITDATPAIVDSDATIDYAVVRVAPPLTIEDFGFCDVTNQVSVRPPEEYEGVYFDLLYVDAPSMADSLSNQWALADRSNIGVLTDTGAADRLPPQELPNDLLRFYRLSAPGLWEENPRRASAEVVVLNTIHLRGGVNWVALPGIVQSVHSACANKVDVFGRNSLPAGHTIPNGARVSWYARGLGQIQTKAVWLAANGHANDWIMAYPDEGVPVNEEPVPPREGMMVDIPLEIPHAKFTYACFVPQQGLTFEIKGNRRYNFINAHLPAHMHPHDLNLLESGFQGGPYPMASDMLWKLDRDLQYVPHIVWYNTLFNQWMFVGGDPVPGDYLGPNDAFVILTIASEQDWIWTRGIPYSQHNTRMSP